MSTVVLNNLTELEGKIVGVALEGGARIDGCRLIALPQRGGKTFWLCTGSEDVFVTPDQVLDVWEVRSA